MTLLIYFLLLNVVILLLFSLWFYFAATRTRPLVPVVEEKKEEDKRVKCEICKHWIDKSDAQGVNHHGIYGTFPSYYCPMHKKPYDESYRLLSDRTSYYGRVEMTEQGVPTGYKKIEPPKEIKKKVVKK